MGLSDEERIEGLYYSISGMVEASRDLKDKYSFEKLYELCDQLWNNFLGSKGDSGFWFSGSNTDDISSGCLNPFAIRVRYSISNAFADKEKLEKVFNVFNHHLNQIGLLQSVNAESATVMKIYHWLEASIYRLRRYDDKLLQSFATLNKNLSDIQGECFKLFGENDTFAKAYIINNMCKIIYDEYYYFLDEDKRDVVSNWLIKQHIHHDINHFMKTYNENDIPNLVKAHKQLHDAYVKANSRLVDIKFERVKASFFLMEDSFEYEHQKKEMLKMFQGHFTSSQLKQIENMANKSIALSKKNKQKKTEECRKEKSYLDLYGNY